MLAPVLLLVLSQPTSSIPPLPLPFPAGSSETINFLQWNSNDLPKVYQRSEQLPLNDEELLKLAKAGFDGPELVKMIQERRCACDASADGLIRLKSAGIAKEVIAAVSLHGLKPNRGLTLLVTLDFTGEGREARGAFLYFFVDDAGSTRVFSANLNDFLGRSNPNETMSDKSDLLITKRVRRIQLAGELPLKTYGKHEVLVVASANPALTHPSQLTQLEMKTAQTYAFDYPRTSIQSLCRLTAGYKRDAMLAYLWKYMGSRFECEWN
jgi:hypothetical protein